jgi:hypothetical protein
MRVGILTRYRHHEATRAALRIADWVQDHGEMVRVGTYSSPTRRTVDPYWDTHVDRLNRQGEFGSWCSRLSTVVWTHVPTRTELRLANKFHLNTVVISAWEELPQEFNQLSKSIICVVSPSMTANEAMLAHGVINALPVPWDSGVPLVKQTAREIGPRLKVYLPLHDSQVYRVTLRSLHVLQRVLHACPWVDLTVSRIPSRIRPHMRRYFNRLVKQLPGRVTLINEAVGEKRWLEYADHDLTLWFSIVESYGLVGLTSLAMGTPVLGYRAPPLGEILLPANSKRVPGYVEYDRGERPFFSPDYDALETYMLETFNDLDHLQKMRNNTFQGYDHRRDEFDKIWPFILV